MFIVENLKISALKLSFKIKPSLLILHFSKALIIILSKTNLWNSRHKFVSFDNILNCIACGGGG